VEKLVSLMSLLHALEVCRRRIYLAAAANPTMCTMVAVFVFSVPVREKKTSNIVSTVLIIHVKTIESGKGRQDFSRTFMRLRPAWRLSNAMVLTTGLIRKKKNGHALPAAHLSHGMHPYVQSAVVALCQKHSNCEAGGNSCAASCSRWCTERERQKVRVFNKRVNLTGQNDAPGKLPATLGRRLRRRKRGREIEKLIG